MKKFKNVIACVVALSLLFGSTLFVMDASANSTQPINPVFQLDGEFIDVSSAEIFSITLRTRRGTWQFTEDTDVTAWFVNEYGNPAFIDASGVATASIGRTNTILELTLDASEISEFNTNGSGQLLLIVPEGSISGRTHSDVPVKVGTYTIPELRIDSSILGGIFTGNTVAGGHPRVPTFGEDSQATLRLILDGLDNDLIDSSNAIVILDDGDGYYPEEYMFNSAGLVNPWIDGETIFRLESDDIAKNAQDIVPGVNNERAWTTLGGDGQGNYIFNLTVSGITYNGLPVASQTFRARIFVHGRDFVYDVINAHGGAGLFPNGLSIEPNIRPLENLPEVTTEPVWTWVKGDSYDIGRVILVDLYPDDLYISWPASVDASSLASDDIRLTMLGQFGDKKVLVPDVDYFVNSTESETQIAIVYINLPFIPVFDRLEIRIYDSAMVRIGADASWESTRVYDIASVYVYFSQFGGTGPVRGWSFYGFENLDYAHQLIADVYYTLSVEINGEVKYYAYGYFVNSAGEAQRFDGNGPHPYGRNRVLHGNHVSVLQTRAPLFPVFEERVVDGQTHNFTRNFSGAQNAGGQAGVAAGGLLMRPSEINRDPDDPNTLRPAPGYVIPNETSLHPNWVTMEKWAWESSVDVGWRHLDIQPTSLEINYTNNVPTIQLTMPINEQFTTPNTPSVTWGIVRQQSAGTTISEDGFLTVAYDETASTITIYAYVPGECFNIGAVHISINRP